jgi:hypothetical protein
MSPTKTKKRFDCLAFKDKVQAEIYEEIKDLSVEEQIRYFNRAAETGPLAKWWKAVRAATRRRKGL